QDRFVLRRRAAVLHVQVDDFPSELIESVSWQLDDGKVMALASAGDFEWSADLGPKLDWTRKLHTVRVVLRAGGDDPRQFPAEVSLRYQPPPPELTLAE